MDFIQLVCLFVGHRFRTTYDFGFAALDVLGVYGEDSGEYTCRATNKLGQAQSSVKLNVKSKCKSKFLSSFNLTSTVSSVLEYNSISELLSTVNLRLHYATNPAVCNIWEFLYNLHYNIVIILFF